MSNSVYYLEIKKQLEQLATLNNSIFLGQQCNPETMYKLLENIPLKKRIELGVMEECQMGMSLGLALEGYFPISMYQRCDFLPRAADAIINHLDLLKELSRGLFNPKILIVTSCGSHQPLDVGLQHNKDLSKMFKVGLRNVKVMNPKTVKSVTKSFEIANQYNGSSLLIFYQDLFHND